MPDQKVWAGGVAGIIVWLLTTVAARYGYALSPEVQTMLPVLVGYVISYVVPPSVRDIVKRIDGQIVEIVAKDPTIPLVKK